jgi:hypothetical protein
VAPGHPRVGRGFVPAFVADDALAQKVYMTFEDKNKNKTIDEDEIDCPLDMVSILAKLEKTDAKDCVVTGLRAHVALHADRVAVTTAAAGAPRRPWSRPETASGPCPRRGPGASEDVAEISGTNRPVKKSGLERTAR